MARCASRKTLADLFDRAQSSLIAAVQRSTDELVESHLRPALGEVLDQARECAAALDGRSLDPATLLDAPKAAVEASAPPSGSPSGTRRSAARST